MSRNFSGLEYGNCRDFTHGQMQMQCFIHLKVNFEKKNPVLPIEKFPILVLARNTITLQHLIIHFSLHYRSSGRLREVKNRGKFQILTSKSGRGRLRGVSDIVN